MEMSQVFEDIIPIILKQLLADTARGCSHCYLNYNHSTHSNLSTVLQLASLNPSLAKALSPFLTSDNIWRRGTPRKATRLLRELANLHASPEVGFIPKTRVSTLWVALAADNLKQLNLTTVSRPDSHIDILRLLKYHNVQLHSLKLPSLEEHPDHLVQTTLTECLLPSRNTLRELSIEVNGRAVTRGLGGVCFKTLNKLHIQKPRNGSDIFGEPVWWAYEVNTLLVNLYDSGSRLESVSVSRIHHRHLGLPRISTYAPTVHTVSIGTQTPVAAETIGYQHTEELKECFGATKHFEFSGKGSLDIVATWKTKNILPELETISILSNSQPFYTHDPTTSVDNIGHLISKLELGADTHCPSKRVLQQVLPKCPNLEYLKIHVGYSDIPILGNYLTKAFNLKQLRIRFCMYRHDDDLKGFGAYLAERLLEGKSILQHLEIDCLYIPQALVQQLLTRFGTTLTCFRVAAASENTPSGLDLTEADSSSIFKAAMNHCLNIECLDIWERDEVVNVKKMPKLSSETINKAYRTLPKLGYVSRPRLERLE